MTRRKAARVRTPTILQYDAAECGAVALGIVLSYYRCYVPLEELRVACGVSRDGSNALNIVRAARQYGMEASGVRRSNLEGLQALAAPLILYWNFNHFVVFEGTDQHAVYINDPSTGPRAVTRTEFNQSFTGLVLICTPSPTFQRRGEAFSVVRTLRERLRGSERGVITVGLVSVLLLIPGFMLPALFRFFIDNVLGSQPDLIGLLMIGMTAAFLGRVLLTWWQQWLLLRLEYQLAFDSSRAFFEHVLHLPIAFFAQRLSGDLVARVQLNQRIAHLLSGELATAAIGVLLMGFYGLLMLTYDVPLTFISLLFAALSFAALRYAAGARSNANFRLLQEQAKLSGTATNGLQAMESLKAGGMESNFFAQWAGLQAKVVNAEQALARIAFLTNAVPFLLVLLNTALILIIGGERILARELTIGVVVAFQSLALSFMQPLSQLTGLGTQVQEIEGSLSRLHDVLAYPADDQIPTEEPIGNPSRLTGRLTVTDLTFGYSPLDAPLLKSISFELQPGQQIALVGVSGSGKSTIAKLIAALYTPWSGEILLDGTPRARLSWAVRDSSLAMVDQTIVLFGGTVRDNLTLWDQTIPLETVIAAAQAAEIHEMIMDRVGGYDSLIEEGGVNFSGGERQRLELARALVRNPTLLILDEATSALDMPTEQRILDHLRRRGCACLTIAHRLSAIQTCDEILVLEKGQLVWRGAYPEYIQREQAYTLTTSKESIPIDRDITRIGMSRAEVRQALNPRFDEVLYQALSQVFEQAQIYVPESVLRSTLERTPQSANHIHTIAKACHVRARRVKLIGDGWRTSESPLLGYLAENDTPIALIPNRRGRMRISEAGQTVPLTTDQANRLSSTAYMFYKPLPDRSLRRTDLLHYTLPLIRSEVWTAIGLVIVIGLLSLLVPIVTGTLFDTVIPIGNRGGLWLLGGLLVSSAIAVSLLNLAAAFTVSRIEGKLDHSVQAAIWDRLLRLPMSFFRAYNVGDLAERTMGVSQIRSTLADVGAYVLVGGVLAIMNGLLLFVFDSTLALPVIGLFVLYLLVVILLGRRQIRFQRQALDFNGEQRSFALQLIAGIRKLRVAGAENRAFDLWLTRFTREKQADYAARVMQNVLTTFMAGYPIVVTALLFFAVTQDGHLTAGSFLAFNVAFVQLLAAGSQLSKAFSRVQSALPILDRLMPIVQAVPEVKAADQPVGDLRGQIRIDGVSFRYSENSRYVLDRLSLEVTPGEFVAITSPSGSGKSTLLRLLLGFEKPERGEVYYDDQPLSALDIESVRSQIGVVLQNGLLITGDILTNIIGSRDLTIADAWRGAELATVAEDIKQMPMGMNTYLGEGSSSLSGGQIQRLLIARALAARPKIVFFDEATSSVDEYSQRVIMQNLKSLDVTCVVIAHRLSTVMNADRIYLLQDGHLIETEKIASPSTAVPPASQ